METITAFFSSIWNWFVENKDEITAFFMSGQAISFVAALVMLVRNIKSTKDNTSANSALMTTLENTNVMSNDVTSLKNDYITLKIENEMMRSELREYKESEAIMMTEITDKLNAIIEVQSVVYSTIRDDGVRKTVNNLLNNARYKDVSTKAQLQEQIENIKATFEEELTKVKDSVNSVISNTSDTINQVETAQERIKEVNRY